MFFCNFSRFRFLPFLSLHDCFYVVLEFVRAIRYSPGLLPSFQGFGTILSIDLSRTWSHTSSYLASSLFSFGCLLRSTFPSRLPSPSFPSHSSGILSLLVFPRWSSSLFLFFASLFSYSFSAPFLFNLLSYLSFHSTSTSPFLFVASENTTILKSLLYSFIRHLYSSHQGLRYIIERETDRSSALIFQHASLCDIVRIWSNDVSFPSLVEEMDRMSSF